MTRHVCALDGHVVAHGWRECLVCDNIPKPDEKILRYIERNNGELSETDSIATIEEWGPASC